MFFLVRSAFCIGAVAFMLPGPNGGPELRDMVAAGRSASTELTRRCAQSRECVTAGFKLAGWAAAQPSIARATSGTGKASADTIRPSTDTLRPEDRLVPWRGPARQGLI